MILVTFRSFFFFVFATAAKPGRGARNGIGVVNDGVTFPRYDEQKVGAG